MGYNLLYGLHKASYDADCSLFLGVLRGDVKEDVYIQTAQLQAGPRWQLHCCRPTSGTPNHSDFVLA